MNAASRNYGDGIDQDILSLGHLDKIWENYFNLNIPQYADTFEEEIDITATIKERKELQIQLKDIKESMCALLKEPNYASE